MNVLLPQALLLRCPLTLCRAWRVGAVFSLVERICFKTLPFTLSFLTRRFRREG